MKFTSHVMKKPMAANRNKYGSQQALHLVATGTDADVRETAYDKKALP